MQPPAACSLGLSSQRVPDAATFAPHRLRRGVEYRCPSHDEVPYPCRTCPSTSRPNEARPGWGRNLHGLVSLTPKMVHPDECGAFHQPGLGTATVIAARFTARKVVHRRNGATPS